VADITALAAELADMGATVDAKLAALNAPPQVVRLPVSGTLALTPASGVRVHAVMLVQDPVGGRTVTWPSTVVWDGGTPPTLSTAPGAVDRVILQSWGEDGQWLASLTGRFSVPTPDVVVTPTAPTFLDASGTAGDTYTIPACTGVTYFVGISEKAAGTYAGAGTVTVTAQAKLGYALQGTTTWAWTYSTSPPPPPPDTVTVIADNATWKWRYDAATIDAAWKATTFDDSTWKTGAGPLGFGTTGLGTTIDTGMTTTTRPLSAQFRNSFSVADKNTVTAVNLSVIVNDGAVVYVNGTEVGRMNMGTGTVTQTSYATAAPTATVANSSRLAISVPLSLIVTGTNVVAVETHLNYRSTTDASFAVKADVTS